MKYFLILVLYLAVVTLPVFVAVFWVLKALGIVPSLRVGQHRSLPVTEELGSTGEGPATVRYLFADPPVGVGLTMRPAFFSEKTFAVAIVEERLIAESAPSDELAGFLEARTGQSEPGSVFQRVLP